jgi:hypothetical protein
MLVGDDSVPLGVERSTTAQPRGQPRLADRPFQLALALYERAAFAV